MCTQVCSTNPVARLLTDTCLVAAVVVPRCRRAVRSELGEVSKEKRHACRDSHSNTSHVVLCCPSISRWRNSALLLLSLFMFFNVVYILCADS